MLIHDDSVSDGIKSLLQDIMKGRQFYRMSVPSRHQPYSQLLYDFLKTPGELMWRKDWKIWVNGQYPESQGDPIPPWSLLHKLPDFMQRSIEIRFSDRAEDKIWEYFDRWDQDWLRFDNDSVSVILRRIEAE
jgi:hypothetical protein